MSVNEKTRIEANFAAGHVVLEVEIPASTSAAVRHVINDLMSQVRSLGDPVATVMEDIE